MNSTKKTIMRIVAFSLAAGMAVPYTIPENTSYFSSINAAEASESDTFLSSVGTENATVVNNGEDSFVMNGRTYYQGITFSGSWNRSSTVTFDVSNADTIVFDLGHIAGSGTADGTMKIYCDDVDVTEEEPIALTYGMFLNDMDIDVSMVKTIKFVITYSNPTGYALGNIRINEKESALKYTLPKYSKAEDITANAYDVYNTEVYSCSKAAEEDTENKKFMMNGRNYYEGFGFTGSWNTTSSASINVEGVKKLSFDLGHIEGTGQADGKLEVYFDNIKKDEINLSYGMFLNDKSYDVSKISTVRFVVTYSNPTGYAIGDIKCDSAEITQKCAVPEAKTNEAFAFSAFDQNGCSVYNNTKKNIIDKEYRNFMMNGRTYWQGVTFSGSWNTYSSASFNVENIDKLTFDLAHVSGEGMADGTLSIYLNNTLTETIPLTYGMLMNDYSVDVSKASTIRFHVTYKNPAAYAIGDLKFDSTEMKKRSIIPEFSSAEELTESAFDIDGAVTYFNSKENEIDDELRTFKMNGRTYCQGITMSGSWNKSATASINVENIKTLTFDLGHVSDTGMANGKLLICLDNEITEEIDLTYGMLDDHHSIDVSEASTVRFYMTFENPAQYALGDFSFDKIKPEQTSIIPECKNGVEFAASAYDSVNAVSYIAQPENEFSTENLSFTMNGEKYDQGVTLSGSWNQNASVSYNVENLYSVSFKIGHIDGSGDNSGIMTIFHNGSEIGNIELTPSMAIQTLTIETYDLSTIRFVTGFENAASYGIADFSVVEAEKREESDLPLPPEPPVIIVLPTADAADVNDDGIVSVCDFIRLVKRVVSGKSDANDKAFDINDDGKVDSADALLLKTFLMN